MGDSDAEKGGLLSLTYASPPEWDCPPPGGCSHWTLNFHISTSSAEDSPLRWNYPFRVYLTYSFNIIILDSLENLKVTYTCIMYITDSKSHLIWPIKLRVAMVTVAILDSIFFNEFARQQKISQKLKKIIAWNKN